jgi:hypothetical protein
MKDKNDFDYNIVQFSILKCLDTPKPNIKVEDIPPELRSFLPKNDNEAQKTINSELSVMIHESVPRVRKSREGLFERTESGNAYVEFIKKRIEKLREVNEKFKEQLEETVSANKKTLEQKESEEISFMHVPFVELNGCLYQQVYDPGTDISYFVSFDGNGYEKIERIEFGDKVFLPNELERDPRDNKPIIILASEPVDYKSIPNLIEKIENFIYKYGDVSDTDRRLLSLFVILTWVYDKMESVPYARFLADTGKGKTRMLKILHQLCYNSFMAAGCSTISGALRMQSKWKGTAFFNEVDFKNTEDTAMFVKWVNNGFERGLPIIMSNKENPNLRDIFDPFGPKVFAMKRPFEDAATEARLISVNMYETRRKDIPILLPPEFYQEGLRIRNMLLDFRLKNWNTIVNVPEEAVAKVRELDVEPRLKQLMLPLLPIVVSYNGGLEEFIKFIKERQVEIRKQRANSWEGTIFNIMYAIATGDDTYRNEFFEYRDQDNNMTAVTTKMIADELKTSAKMVASALKSIGFDIERKYVEVRKARKAKEDVECEKKVVRCIVVQRWSKWSEAVSRYYADYKDEVPEVPECLKSEKYIDDRLSSVNAVKSVNSVKTEQDKQTELTCLTGLTPMTEDRLLDLLPINAEFSLAQWEDIWMQMNQKDPNSAYHAFWQVVKECKKTGRIYSPREGVVVRRF